jgi:uncharacterized membrane protein
MQFLKKPLLNKCRVSGVPNFRQLPSLAPLLPFFVKKFSMKKGLSCLFLLTISYGSYACITCNQKLQEAIYNNFYPNLFTMLLAFIALGIVIAALSFTSTRKHKAQLAMSRNAGLLNPVPLTTAAMVLGIGLGGFIDGIVLHQILQWHEMLSNKLPPDTLLNKSVNMFWDGVFHAFTLVTVFMGIVLLWKLLYRKDIDRSGRLLAGGLLLGWGWFNIIEGLIDHHILKLHNVREITENKEAWNYGFLGFSLLLLFAGYVLINRKIKI